MATAYLFLCELNRPGFDAASLLAKDGSAWAVAQALGPKLGVGSETLRKGVLQAQTDVGRRSGPTSEELAEIKRLEKENAE
jgi:transposase-like protein